MGWFFRPQSTVALLSLCLMGRVVAAHEAPLTSVDNDFVAVESEGPPARIHKKLNHLEMTSMEQVNSIKTNAASLEQRVTSSSWNNDSNDGE